MSVEIELMDKKGTRFWNWAKGKHGLRLERASSVRERRPGQQ